MPETEANSTLFRRASLLCLVAAAAASATALVVSAHGPKLGTVALFGSLVLLSENVGLRLPTPVAVSPQLILVMAAIVVLRPNGTVPGAMAVGACGGLLFEALRSRHLALVAFNTGQMALSAGAAALVFTQLGNSGASLGELVYILTAASYVIVNHALVVPMAVHRSGAPAATVIADLRSSALSDLFFGLVGLLIGDLFNSRPHVALIVIVGSLVIAQTVFLSVVRLRQAHTRLELLYRFTQRLERSQDERNAVMSVLLELRTIMNADTAELTTLEDSGWRRTWVTGDRQRPGVSDGTGAPAEAHAVDGGPTAVRDLVDGSVRREIAERAGPDALVVPMRVESRLLGTITIGHPREGRTYKLDDLRLLEALANHAAISLDNSRLLSRLRYDSSHDGLTALPNRARFNELIGDLPDPSAVLIVDLDRFKEINDTVGHQYGDLLLLSVAQRITEEVSHRGIVARLGGDEFGVLLPQTGSGDAAQCAVSLLAAIEQPFAVGGLELEITASIGVAVAHGPEAEAGRLLQQADVAMYSAKEAHSGWEVYSTERDHYSPRRLALAGELRHAIDAGELEVHYQPKSDLRTGTVHGLEALVRWRHPRYGTLGPDQFVPVAESAGLIRPLTFMVLDHAVALVRELQSLGYDLEVAVNLSVRSVLDVNLPDHIAQVLAAHDVAPSKLTLEITEGSVMADPSRTIGILGRLAGLGASISLDDFGTGYSSLSYLKRLPACEVKIDQSFVAGMLANDSDAAIVRSTVDLAHNLGLQAVAEGVEDKATWDALAELGCDFAQGYFVSPALPAEELRTWLLRRDPAVDPSA